MKRTIALALSLASGLVLNAAAQTPSPAAAAPAPAPIAATPAKVAVIAFAAAVAQTNEGQRTLGDVQRKFQPKRDQLKAASDEIDNLKKQLQAQGEKLSAAESATRTKAIDDKTKQLQRSAEDAQNDYNQEMGEAINSLETKVYETVETYAKEQGFTLVLDGSQQQTPILWFAETTNITPQIIAAYNAKSGVPAPPPQSQTPAAPKPAAPKPTTPAAPKK
jgi:outer membrane protein